MTLKLHVAPEAATASKGVINILCDLLKRARAGEIHSLGVAFIAKDEAQFDLEIEDGDALTLASVCRQMDEAIRAAEFDGGD